MRFDEQSFKEEITNEAEANNCYRYLTQNLGGLQMELATAGASYEEMTTYIHKIWSNFITACTRVGFTNPHIEAVKKELARAQNKE